MSFFTEEAQGNTSGDSRKTWWRTLHFKSRTSSMLIFRNTSGDKSLSSTFFLLKFSQLRSFFLPPSRLSGKGKCRKFEVESTKCRNEIVACAICRKFTIED
jgi:hypothetical protein